MSALASTVRMSAMSEGVDAVVADDAVRAGTYSLLGALLAAPPDGALIERLRGIEASGDDVAGSFATAWETLRLAADRATVEALDDEYHALFIGVGRGELVPYGSWYVTGFTMDKPLAVLRRDLEALGFARQDDVREPEDHVAALCETMGIIITAGDVDFDAERRFFQEHIGPWMAGFFHDLQKARASRFYRAVGQLGERFIEFEKQYLNMLA